MKTNELTGTALDWAVAKAEGLLAFGWEDDMGLLKITLSTGETEYFTPTMKWEQSGPIIEREGISVMYRTGVRMIANINGQYEQTIGHLHKGNLGLIVAMRCYVASKLGDDIEIPKELT
jgi:hypothetical protein